MKVALLLSWNSLEFGPHGAGEVIDVPDAVGAQLIADRVADASADAPAPAAGGTPPADTTT